MKTTPHLTGSTVSNLNAWTRRILASVALLALFAPVAAAQSGPLGTLGSRFPLYVSMGDNSTISRVDSTGALSLLTAGESLVAPVALAFDGSGNLYVASFSNHAIIKVDSTGAQSLFSAGENLDGPNGLAFDGSGNLYVASLSNDTIVKVDSTGAQNVFTAGENLDGPYGLAFDGSGNLYVASFSNDTIVKVDSVGAQSVFTGGATFDGPRGLAFDGSGNLYVANQNGHTIVRIDSTGAESIFTPSESHSYLALAFTRGYDFSGFLGPVDSAPTVNVAKAGSAVPVEFSLGGDQGLGIFAAGFPASQQVACSSTDPTSDVEETVTARGNSLTYDPVTNQYTYIWKTNKAWKGTCRKLIVKLNDGTEHTANFQFQ